MNTEYMDHLSHHENSQDVNTHTSQTNNPDQLFGKDLNTLLKQDYGPRLIGYLLSQYGLFKPSYCSGKTHTDYNEGMRSAALFLSQAVSIQSPNALPLVFEEMQKM